jgi:hypothetical protein
LFQISEKIKIQLTCILFLSLLAKTHVTPNTQSTSSEQPLAMPAVSHPDKPLLGLTGMPDGMSNVGFVGIADAASLDVS